MDSNHHQYKITVLIPCKNEEKFIAPVLDNIVAQDVDKTKLEVLVLDGMSDDNTRQIVEDYTKTYSYIQLVDNPHGYVPYALNKGIQISTGEIIIRMDAHSQYPKNYISVLAFQIMDLEADNVGGYWKILPGDKSSLARAIAVANQSPIGTGGASYRSIQDEITEVDTVPFGCFRRSIFEKVGMFDTDLIRNQDDEMNARIKLNGGKIYLIPDIEIKYYARTSIGKTMKMFYQYGLYKPLVNKKLGRISSIRQLAPFILVLSLIFFAIGGSLNSFILAMGIIAIGTYLLLMIVVGMMTALRNRFFPGVFLLPLLFVLIHVSYGWGYLIGAIKLLFGKKPHPASISR